MIHRKFTSRETVLLLVLSILLLGIFYYMVLYGPVSREVERCAAEMAPLEDDLNLQKLKAAKKKKMVDELERAPKKIQGELLPYNNIKGEIADLYDALRPAAAYSLSFSEAVASKNIVRRDVSISFQADSYHKVRSIINRMHDSPYRCIVRDISISADKTRDGSQGMSDAKLVNVNTTVTFYETLTGAENTNGLVFEKQQSGTDGETAEQE